MQKYNIKSYDELVNIEKSIRDQVKFILVDDIHTPNSLHIDLSSVPVKEINHIVPGYKEIVDNIKIMKTKPKILTTNWLLLTPIEIIDLIIYSIYSIYNDNEYDRYFFIKENRLVLLLLISIILVIII